MEAYKVLTMNVPKRRIEGWELTPEYKKIRDNDPTAMDVWLMKGKVSPSKAFVDKGGKN